MQARVASMVALFASGIGLYGAGLGVGPWCADERQLQTQLVAFTANRGRDDGGRFLPVFVHVRDEVWLAPVPLYATVVMTTLRPAFAANIRWSAVLMGSLNIVLMYVLADQIFRHRSLAFAAALALLTTPSHFIYARLATSDGVWQLPFILLWLIGLAVFLKNPRGRSGWMLTVGAAALAASVYSQPSAAVMVPLFAAIGMAALWRTHGCRRTEVAVAAAVFIAVLAPLLMWFAAYPSTYVHTLGRWLLHPAHLRSPIAWAAAASNWLTLTIWADMSWRFFAPSFLFFNPGAPGFCGVFLLPVAVMIVVGVFAIVRSAGGVDGASARTAINGVILLGFLVGPLAVATFKEPPAIEHALVMVPFGVLLAAIGAETLWSEARTMNRVLAALLLIAVPLQFSLAYERLAAAPESPAESSPHDSLARVGY